MKSRQSYLYWFVLAFAGGIVLNEIALFEIKTIFLYIGILIFLLLSFYILNRLSVLLLMIIISFFFTAGFVRSFIKVFADNRSTQLTELVGQKVTLTGVLQEEQERRDHNTRLYLRIKTVGDREVDFNEKILITTKSPKEFRYGDIVRVDGKLVLPENFYTDTGREFDYIGYLYSSDIRFLIRNASVAILGHDPPSKIIAGLFYVKRIFVNSLYKMLPEPESSLASGILIDGKQSINGELQEKFRKTGLVHIVVLSGYNVSIIAEAIGRIFMFLPRLAGLSMASVGIVAFALITGASATVVRASIMAILVLFSRMAIRNYDPARGLFIASGLMLVHNPTILFHSPSFQLSFLATFCMVRIVPLFEKRMLFLPEKFGLRELILSNITVQLFLFPILAWMTGFFSAVSLPVNLLVLPLIPLTMLASFMTAITGIFYWSISLPFAFVSHILLSYELIVVDFFSKFSLAEIPVSNFSGWIVMVFYVTVVVYFLYFFEVRKMKFDKK